MLNKQFSPIEQQKDLDDMWNYLDEREKCKKVLERVFG